MKCLQRKTIYFPTLPYFLLFNLHISPSFSYASRFGSQSFSLPTFFHSILLQYVNSCKQYPSVFSDRHPMFNRNVCRLYTDAFRPTAFRHEFRARSFCLNIFQAQQRKMRSSVPSDVKTRQISVAALGMQTVGAALKLMFCCTESGVLHELRTEQILHVLKTTPFNGTISKSNARVADMFSIVFKSRYLSLTYIIAKCYIQLHLGGSKEAMFTNLLHAPTAFELLFYFHTIALVEKLKNYQRFGKFDPAATTIPVTYKSLIRIGNAVHLLIKARKLVLCGSVLGN